MIEHPSAEIIFLKESPPIRIRDLLTCQSRGTHRLKWRFIYFYQSKIWFICLSRVRYYIQLSGFYMLNSIGYDDNIHLEFQEHP